MSNNRFVLLPAFGSAPGENWFRTAYTWNIVQIFQWLEDVSNGKKGGPRALDPDVQKTLQDIYAKIKSLSLPDGVNYIVPDLRPNSHFPRSLNEDWGDGTDRTKSKFRLHEWPNKHRRGPKNAEVQIPYCNPYDLLGCFLSLLGPAPQSANKNNYFLPLTAVFGKWCSRIAGHAPGFYHYPVQGTGAGTWPYMFQCTWHAERTSKPRKWFWLGASISGDPFLPHETGSWKTTVLQSRFNMMYTSLQIGGVIRANDFEKKRAPEQTKADGTGIPFGGCAESYPFAEKMFSEKIKNKDLYGVALQRDYMRDPTVTEYDQYRDGVVWANLSAPCRNCAYIVNKSGALAQRFAVDFDIARAPPKPQT